MRRSLTKIEILRKKEDINRIFSKGRRYNLDGMRLISLSNNLSYDRFIVIPAKKYGNSVERNKIRRQAKEIFRNWEKRHSDLNGEQSDGLDIILVVYPGRVSGFSLLESDFHSLLDRIIRK